MQFTILSAAWLGLLLCCAPSLSAQDTVRLGEGGPTVVIAGEGGLLKKGLERSLGRQIRLVANPDYEPAPGELPIHIGGTPEIRAAIGEAAETLDVEGYIIRVEPERIFLYATNPPETDTGNPLVWAQLDFLRRFLKADHYFPGELGEVYPRHQEVDLPVGMWVETPAFLYRQWSGFAGAAPGWRVRASGGGGRYRFHHNLYRIISPEKYASRPDYFPVIYAEDGHEEPRIAYKNDDLKPGQRFIPGPRRASYWQPCTSNPEVVSITAAAALKEMAAQRGNPVFSLGINDSGGHCHCAKCLTNTPPGVAPTSRAADGYRVYQFYDEVARTVAKEEPKARLGFLVYQALNSAPPETLHPNLMPFLTLSMADHWDPKAKADHNERLGHWKKRAQQFGVYDWLFGQGYIIPRLYLQDEAEGLRHLYELGCRGFYAEGYANWGLDGPKLWVMERLLWNPQQDVNRLIEEWCRGLFGPAASPMRAYFEALEKAWVSQNPTDSKRGGYRLHGIAEKGRQLTEVFPPAVCDAAWELLGSAEEAAATAPDSLRRVRYFKAAFAFTRYLSHRYAASQRAAELSGGNFGDSETLRALALAYGEWKEIGPIEPLFADLREHAPLAFQEQAQEAAGALPDFTSRLRAWDSDFPLQHRLATALVDAALGQDSGHPTPEALDEAMTATVHSITDSPSLREALLALARRNVLIAEPLDGPLTVEGMDAWGKPAFTGSFIDYPSQTAQNGYRTDVWVGHDGDTLYTAIRSFQPEGAFGGADVGRNHVKLDAYGVLDLRGSYERHFPYLYANPGLGVTRCNSVGVSVEGAFFSCVTAEGSFFDARATPTGLSPQAEGVEASVRRLPDGWVAVFRIPHERLPSNGLVQNFNVTRVAANRKSALIPGMPSRWAITPRTGGVLLYRGVSQND